MKRFVSSMLVMLCLSVSAVAMAEVKVWKAEELLTSDKLVAYGQGFRDTALQPFNPKSNAMKGVLENAEKANVKNIQIMSEGERNEKNKWGLGGVYYVVEALEVTFVEPTKENIENSLTQRTPTYVEITSAISHGSKSPNAKDYAKILLQRIKGIKHLEDVGWAMAEYNLSELMINGYATFLQKESVPELSKILKYHSVDKVRTAAGKQLIKMGELSVVEDAIERNEKSDKVRTALKKSLME